MTEGDVSFDAPSFTMLAIRDRVLANGRQPSEWHLIPLVSGTPRHSEAFTRSTFWVTRYRWSETLADNLLSYIAPPEPVANSDVVLWYYAGLHHLVRDEDVDMTHLMWIGFMLKPANVWARTPLFP